MCARCHRPLQHAVQVAGMKVGRECRRAIVDAVLQREPAAPAPDPDPRQMDFFQAQDLFGATAAQEQL